MAYTSSWEFEVGVILLTILVLAVLRKSNPKILRRFWLTFIGVFLFEYFTQPLWINQNLQPWAYLYLDVSWIITLCWTNLILLSMASIESLFPKLSEGKKFASLMALVTIAGLYLEWLFLRLNIRVYPDAVQQIINATPRIAGVVPLIEILYIPTFIGLIIGFIKYWEISLSQKEPKIKGGRRK
jgi:hypothetical protein